MFEASDLTCRRSSIPGIVLTVFAARVSANARASSAVLHSLFQLALSGAPIKACISGLISAVAVGSAFAGTSSGARSVAVAAAEYESNAAQAIALKDFMAFSSLCFLVEPNTTHRRKVRR